MTAEFRIPELGENIEYGTVTKVLVAAGDAVAKEQAVVELETDKAVVEVPCSVAGKVAKVHVKEGDKVSVGQVILTLDEAAGAGAQEKPSAEPRPPAAPSPSKEARPKSAPRSAPAAPAGTPPAEPAAPAPGAHAPVVAAPSVRHFAREIGIDIAQVPASGPGGRLSIEDVKRYAKQLNTSRGAGPAAPAYTLPDFSKWGETERRPLNAVRAKIAQHMGLAWSTVPHVTQFDWADITDLEERRKKLVPKAEKAGAKLTVTAILVKIAAAALKVFPNFNASLDLAKSELVLKKYIHIGIAVDTERGLLVPVIRDADRKNIIQIAVELVQAAQNARDAKVALEDLQGGTFTVTNLGGIGGTHFTPIVNFPEVAILGVGRARTEPAFSRKEGCCSPRLMLPLSLSYDHRVIDGADGARFLRWIVEAIEEPLMIPLEG